MLSKDHWARHFTVSDADIEYLVSYLLETETPLSIHELTRALVQRRLTLEAEALKAKFKDVLIYNPSGAYKVGQKILFPALDHATATVVGERAGSNPDYGDFTVIAVAFDGEPQNGRTREFAANFKLPHRLSASTFDASQLPGANSLTVDDILQECGDTIATALEERLRATADLVVLAGKWFPRSLMLEVNIGHLNLAEAVLDINQGGPLLTEEILREIGGLGNAPKELQIFSLNYALSTDGRFDEVGPVDTVLWFLKRLEPAEVLSVPSQLRYTSIPYDEALLTPEMRALEREIDDEWSDGDEDPPRADEVSITLIYPHRRVGTLPLNNKMRQIFPTARRTERIWVTLVDGQDGEEFPGWVVRNARYVFGLGKLYRKHKLPIGATVLVRAGSTPDKIVVDFRSHRPRTEYVRLIVPKDGQITFEDQKRLIGAEYDDLMVLGADDLAAVDALHTTYTQSRKTPQSLLRALMTELARHSPQGTVHAKTVYSAFNVVRRCPPAPIFALLAANPDFEYVGSHYWKIAAD